MCQIIQKPADYTLPYYLLATTCNVNADGWGLMLYDKDKKELYYSKTYDGDNDPVEIYEMLKDLHDYECFLHFRYRTKGKVNEDSCHPFLVYDNYDKKVVMMHNGTITGYGDDNKVDSQDFGEKIIGPVFETFLKSGVRNPLGDELFQKVIKSFIGAHNKIVLMDEAGNSVILNESSGEMYTEDNEGNPKKFWISNDYSFNFYHRSNSYKGNSFRPTKEDRTPPTQEEIQKRSNNVSNVSSIRSNTTSDSYNTEFDQFWGHPGSAVDNWKDDGKKRREAAEKSNVGKVPVRMKNKTYWGDVCKLEEIDDLLDMTQEDISDLVDTEPEHAKMFINDLIFELYQYMWGVTSNWQTQNPDFKYSAVRENVDSTEDTTPTETETTH